MGITAGGGPLSEELVQGIALEGNLKTCFVLCLRVLSLELQIKWQ